MNAGQKKERSSDKLVMLVDDEPDMLSMLGLVVQKKCQCAVLTAASGKDALALLEHHQPDVIVSDIRMPDVDGLTLLQKIRQRDKDVSVIIMTGYGSIDTAVQALKDGAYDFLEKPFDKDHIVRVINNGLERTSLLRSNQNLRAKLETLAVPEGFVGNSPPLRKVFDLLNRVADTDATVLIRGESGTGKELAARALHNLSHRQERRMITVNCPALPENVLESELFGYSKGAFTGATAARKGLFLEAHGSTILLDEIADIPVSIQTKLLRVLQEKEIQPLGQNKTIAVDVRVVASTNQDLEEKIKAGEFREDLFYRLNVVPVHMPSLADMTEDLPLLIHHFFTRFKQQYQRKDLQVPPDILQTLYQRQWQGNVRELENSINRLVLLSSGQGVTRSDLETLQLSQPCQQPCQQSCQETKTGKDSPQASQASPVFTDLFALDYKTAKGKVLHQFTTDYLQDLLCRHKGHVTDAAAAAGMERQALQRIMRKHGIMSADFRH